MQQGIVVSSCTFRGRVPIFLSPQHPVDGLALIGSEDRNESFVLDIIGCLPALSLVQVPDEIIELLDVLPLQVGVTFLLIVLYNFYVENTKEKVLIFDNLAHRMC